MPPAHRNVTTTVERAPRTGPGRPASDCGGDPDEPLCCPRLHDAVELIGKRWTGAIITVLLSGGTMRFSQIGQAVPDLSDRLLSERMKELEARGLVTRRVSIDGPVKVEYELTSMGRELRPAMDELKQWADRWL